MCCYWPLNGHLPQLKPARDALRAANFSLTDDLYAWDLTPGLRVSFVDGSRTTRIQTW